MGVNVMRKFFYLNLVMIFLFLVLGCASGFSKDSGEISFACWNAQTFFDANNDGCEYSDFQKKKYWSKNLYLERLNRLADVIRKLDCDVFVLEEIENENVVMDISNQLAGNSWSMKKNWNYTCFAKDDGSAIGCCVFSRLPLSDLKIHSMDVRSEENVQPSSRPIIQVCVNSGDKKLFIFANHWKSKSNGAEESEIWRLWQESLLTERVLSLKKEFGPNVAVILCGDFNKDITEFQRIESVGNSKRHLSDFADGENFVLKNTLILDSNLENEKQIEVYSPWISSNGSFATDIGSYYYKNSWERIDQIFAYGTASISDFQVFAHTPWVTDDGIPIPFKIYTGEGYSDHLPLKCTVTF